MKITDRYGTTLRIYDNGGKTCDRYTIIPPRWAHLFRQSRENGWGAMADRRLFDGIGASESPFHPQGFGMNVSGVMPGSHLGKRISWSALPVDVQRFAGQSFPEYAPQQLDIDAVAAGFIGAALWADCEEGTSPNATKAARENARAFALSFINANLALYLAAIDRVGYSVGRFGYDLYMTAVGHGVGFWDRDELSEDDLGDELTAALDVMRVHVEAEFYRGWMYVRITDKS